MGAQAEIKELRAQVAQLELCVLPGTGLAIDYKPLFRKLGYGGDTTVDAFKNVIARRTKLNYAGKGLDADDTRALAGILGSFSSMVDINELDLGGNEIGNVGMAALANVVETGAFDGLQYLRLAGCTVDWKGIKAFFSACLEHRRVRLREFDMPRVSPGAWKLCIVLISKLFSAGLLLSFTFDGKTIDLVKLQQEACQIGDATLLVINASSSQLTIQQAYAEAEKLSAYVLVLGASPGGRAWGGNPYRHASHFATCFFHLTGLSSGLVRITDSGRGPTVASVAHGVSTGADSGDPIYTLALVHEHTSVESMVR